MAYQKVEIEFNGQPLIMETGKMARQADGAVVITYGETKVLCTVVSAKQMREGQDFFPLTVNYQEKTYAAGRIPGGFFKREGRPSEKETLTSRLIDRPIRPLFPEGYRHETQIVSLVLSADGENDPDILAINGASAALAICAFMSLISPTAESIASSARRASPDLPSTSTIYLPLTRLRCRSAIKPVLSIPLMTKLRLLETSVFLPPCETWATLPLSENARECSRCGTRKL